MRMTLTILLAIALTHTSLLGTNQIDTPDYVDDPKPNDMAEMSVPVLSSFPSELTVDGLASLARGNFAIQMGAFNRRANAESLQHRLEQMLGLTVDVIEEGNMFKVIINSSLLGTAPCLFIPVSFPAPVSERASIARITDKPAELILVEPAATMQDTVPETPAAEPAPAEALPAEEPEPAPAATEIDPQRRNISNFFLLWGDSPWLKRYNYFGKPVALVNALIITIIGSFFSMLVLLVVILLNRNRMEKEARLRQYLLEQYQSLIIDYLFGNTGSEAFRKIASDDYRRQVLIDQMIDVSVNLKGDSEEKLMKLYMELNLDDDSIARARSRKWHKKIKGFRELAFMGIRDGNSEMYKALNSRNEILRMEAQIALVRLSDENHFDFLSQLKRPFSLWEQITLHDLIIQHEIPVPDFQKWLSSTNPTVVMFALRMIREFRQTNAEPEIRKALLHRDPRVSRLAVEVSGDLDLRTTLDTMKRMYKFQEYNNCLEIVKSMGKMPEQSMLGFLKLVLDKEDDVQLQIEAVKAIENMGEVGVQALVKVMKSEYKNYNIIVRHVLDRRIY